MNQFRNSRLFIDTSLSLNINKIIVYPPKNSIKMISSLHGNYINLFWTNLKNSNCYHVKNKSMIYLGKLCHKMQICQKQLNKANNIFAPKPYLLHLNRYSIKINNSLKVIPKIQFQEALQYKHQIKQDNSRHYLQIHNWLGYH